jgi:hypothetical protein
VIAPEASAEFVASMERVLDVYKRPLDARRPVVCMDETPRQLIGQTREPIAAAPGQPEREDYEYRRLGTCNVFMACEPLAGTHMTQVPERRTKRDWALFVESIAAHYPQAERITLVMDNLNTHTPAALYETFAPAKALWDRFEFVHRLLGGKVHDQIELAWTLASGTPSWRSTACAPASGSRSTRPSSPSNAATATRSSRCAPSESTEEHPHALPRPHARGTPPPGLPAAEADALKARAKACSQSLQAAGQWPHSSTPGDAGRWSGSGCRWEG